MSLSIWNRRGGFTLIELVVIIIVLGILSAVAIPKLFNVTQAAEQASVDNMIGSLDGALSLYVAKQYIDGQAITVHNPFDDLSNIPVNYVGPNDPVTAAIRDKADANLGPNAVRKAPAKPDEPRVANAPQF